MHGVQFKTLVFLFFLVFSHFLFFDGFKPFDYIAWNWIISMVSSFCAIFLVNARRETTNSKTYVNIKSYQVCAKSRKWKLFVLFAHDKSSVFSVFLPNSHFSFFRNNLWLCNSELENLIYQLFQVFCATFFTHAQKIWQIQKHLITSGHSKNLCKK